MVYQSKVNTRSTHLLRWACVAIRKLSSIHLYAQLNGEGSPFNFLDLLLSLPTHTVVLFFPIEIKIYDQLYTSHDGHHDRLDVST